MGDIKSIIMSNVDPLNVKINDSLIEAVRRSLAENGKTVQGDNIYSDDTVRNMVPHLIDYALGEQSFFAQFNNSNGGRRAGSYNSSLQELHKNATFRPVDALTDIIVDERLRLFGPMLASFGYNMHLITLPEFHVTAFRMHDLARRFKNSGIEAFVTTTQRPERIRMTEDSTYTYYKHQTATGTGVEAAFNKAVGSSNVNALSASTESDDLKKENLKDTYYLAIYYNL